MRQGLEPKPGWQDRRCRGLTINAPRVLPSIGGRIALVTPSGETTIEDLVRNDIDCLLGAGVAARLESVLGQGSAEWLERHDMLLLWEQAFRREYVRIGMDNSPEGAD